MMNLNDAVALCMATRTAPRLKYYF